MAAEKFAVPIYEPSLGRLEKRLLLRAFASGRISGSGPEIEEFEERFADFVGRSYAVATFNGTVAISLALAALRIGPGSRVLTADYTYVATANSVRHSGAVPVFFDADPATFQPSSLHASNLLDKSIDAVLFPHLYGFPSDLRDFASAALAADIPLVEDCSEILGSVLDRSAGGNHGLMSTYSFFGNKTVTTGEGGMVVTDDEILANRLRLLRNQAAIEGPDYFFEEAGFNYRMTNLQAAIGIAQLSRIGEFLEKKERIFQRYSEALGDLTLLGHPSNGSNSFWLVAALLPHGTSRGDLIKFARAEGVDLRPGFIPMHKLPMYQERPEIFPKVNEFADRLVLLPSFPTLSKKSLRRVVHTIQKGLRINS